MTTLTTAEAQQNLPALVRRVGRGDRVVLRNTQGKDVAAIVSIEDWALLQRILEEAEDRLDGEAADHALAEMRAQGEKPIPWAQVEAERDVARQKKLKVPRSYTPLGRSRHGTTPARKKMKVTDHPYFGSERQGESVESVMERLRGGRYRDI